MIVIEGINHIGFTVSNLEESVRFYRDLFDFDVVDKFSTADQTFMKMGDIIIGLYQKDDYRADDSKNRISFYVDEEDFEDALEELEEREIEIVYGPEDIRNGKTVVFLDPDGNRVELSYPTMS